MNPEDVSHEMKCLVWCLGRIGELTDAGLLKFKGTTNPVSPKGIAHYDQLAASGFRATDLEVRRCLKTFEIRGMLAPLTDEEAEAFVVLITKWSPDQ